MTDTSGVDETDNQRTWMWIAGALALAALVLTVTAIYFFRQSDFPANDSADAGFARDMSVHHAQAVEMADIVYRRTENPDIARLALDIATTQQFQIGMMTGWLDIWDRTVSSDQPPMAWMGDYDMTLPSPPPGLQGSNTMSGMNMAGTPAPGASETTPLMPGMATQAQVDALRTFPPATMDQQFLRLMIRHHQGGVLMAEAALEKASDKHVRNFAQQVINTQSAEIEVMTTMLNDLGSVATPTPTAQPATAAEASMPAMATPVHGEGQ